MLQAHDLDSRQAKVSRLAILDKLFYARPLDKDLQVIGSMLIEMLHSSDKKPLPELAEFLDRWQFREKLQDTYNRQMTHN